MKSSFIYFLCSLFMCLYLRVPKKQRALEVRTDFLLLKCGNQFFSGNGKEKQKKRKKRRHKKLCIHTSLTASFFELYTNMDDLDTFNGEISEEKREKEEARLLSERTLNIPRAPFNEDGGHPLQYGFAFWFVRRSGARFQENYERNVKKIGQFRTVRCNIPFLIQKNIFTYWLSLPQIISIWHLAGGRVLETL